MCWGHLGGPAGLSEVSGSLLLPLLGPSWACVLGGAGLSWAPLRQSWSLVGPSWGRPEGLLGGLGAVLGASSALLDRWKLEDARS